MYQIYRLSVLSLFLSMPASVFAAVPLAVQKVSLKELQNFVQLKFSGEKNMVKSMAVSTPSSQKSTLQMVEQHTDKQQIIHTRMQQQYRGFQVFGGYVILHRTKANHVHMNGLIYSDLEKELGTPDRMFVAQGSAALAHFKRQYQEGEQSIGDVTPMVYLDSQHHAHWAYQVSVLIEHEHSIPEKPTAIIDAKTFKPFIEWNDVKTMYSHVKGMGYGGNERIGEYQYGKDYPLLDISRSAKDDICYLDNAHVKVVDTRHHFHKSANPAASFICDDAHAVSDKTYWTGVSGNGYNRMNGAYSPENDALYIGMVIHQMYQTWYGVNALEKDEKPMKLVMQLHYSNDFENAFWDGSKMTFGDGGERLHPLVSLTVGAHEISHGFTEQHSHLMYFGQSGAMNESFSDMAAQVAEYYAKGWCSWQIGEEIIKKEIGLDALRYLDDPTRDGVSIDSANQYDESIDVHLASGIYNRLFYVLATTPGWNPRLAFHVMLKANMDYWTPFSTFSEGACGILNAARDLNYSTDDVKQALDKVAINYEAC